MPLLPVRKLLTAHGRGNFEGGSNPISLSLDFANSVYSGGSLASLLSCSRPQVGSTFAVKSDDTLMAFAADTARITDLGLFVEASATNLLLQSNNFANASWTKTHAGVASNPTVTANAGTAPDGTNTASRLQFALNGGTTNTDRAQLLQNATTVAGSTYTASIYIKSNTASSYAMIFRNGGGAAGGAITVTPSWQRLSFTQTNAGTSIGFSLELRGAQTPTNADSADILIWTAVWSSGALRHRQCRAVQALCSATAMPSARSVLWKLSWHRAQRRS